MDYTMEDTQNSAPNAHEASKLGPSSQRNDTQGVTKRYVHFDSELLALHKLTFVTLLACNLN